MAAVTTEGLLQVALDLAGWADTPPDCVIAEPGTRISHVLLGVELGVAELFMARQLGYHAVVTYGCAGTEAALRRNSRWMAERIAAVGAPADVAERFAGEVADRQALDGLAHNYDRVSSVAHLLETPLVVIGSPFDELARRRVQDAVDELALTQPKASVADLRDALGRMRQYAGAKSEMALALGTWTARAGRTVAVTGGSPTLNADLARFCLAHGTGTICCPVLASSDARTLRAEGVAGNILALGWLATIGVGITPYVSHLRAEGLEVTALGVVGVSESDHP